MKIKLFIVLIVAFSTVLSACGAPANNASIPTPTPDPAKIEAWEYFVADGDYVVMTIGNEAEDKPIWNKYTTQPGEVASYGLATGSNLIGLALGLDVKYDVTQGCDVSVRKLSTLKGDTIWLQIDVPANLSASFVSVKQTSP